MDTSIRLHIEALIFAAAQPLTLTEIQAALAEVFQTAFPDDDLRACIEQSQQQFASPEFAFELVEIAGGYQFLTKGAYHQVVSAHLKQSAKKRLSQAALETIALVAYKQPVTKSELEEIRGVSCDYALQKLLEKELVAIVGRSESPGRPLLYGTSDKFMDYFGIKSLKDLPQPKDFKNVENTVGEASVEEEVSSEV